MAASMPYQLETGHTMPTRPMHVAVADRFESLLEAGAQALATQGLTAELGALVNFASLLPNRINQATFQRLSRLCNDAFVS